MGKTVVQLTDLISFKTSQYLPIYSVFELDGKLWQVITHVGDYTCCARLSIKRQASIALDLDAISSFRTYPD